MDSIINSAIALIVREIDPDKIILFGSRLKGNCDEHSDIDLLIIKSGIESRRRIAQKLHKALFAIPAAFDILVETPERIANLRSDDGFIISEAIAGSVLYERRSD
jgi:predicted nucleotidyltransferase